MFCRNKSKLQKRSSSLCTSLILSRRLTASAQQKLSRRDPKESLVDQRRKQGAYAGTTLGPRPNQSIKSSPDMPGIYSCPLVLVFASMLILVPFTAMPFAGGAPRSALHRWGHRVPMLPPEPWYLRVSRSHAVNSAHRQGTVLNRPGRVTSGVGPTQTLNLASAFRPLSGVKRS